MDEIEKSTYIGRLQDALWNFSDNPEALDNFISYLERHFEKWCIHYANTPINFINELYEFSKIKWILGG